MCIYIQGKGDYCLGTPPIPQMSGGSNHLSMKCTGSLVSANTADTDFR